jgi:hypothetical protein
MSRLQNYSPNENKKVHVERVGGHTSGPPMRQCPNSCEPGCKTMSTANPQTFVLNF